MPFYIILLAQKLIDFRIPELESIAKLLNIDLRMVDDFYNRDSPYLLVELPNDYDAARLATRSVITRAIDRYIAHASNYEELIEKVKSSPHDLTEYSFKKAKLNLNSYGPKIHLDKRNKCARDFLSLIGGVEVSLDNPEVVFTYYEDYYHYAPSGMGNIPETAKPTRLMFCVRISKGGRGVVSKYDLKKRLYKGTTSLEAEMSLVMANQALVDTGKLVLDPFVGTGSIIIACAHYGAITFGSDINGRNIRGKGDVNIVGNAKQYGVGYRICDNLPPYGIREGSKRIGRDPSRRERAENSCFNPDGTARYPQTVSYKEGELIMDLLAFSDEHLVGGGRLVFWISSSKEWTIPRVPETNKLRLISITEQSFGRWARYLVTMEKGEPRKEPILNLGLSTEWYYGKAREAYFRIGEDKKDVKEPNCPTE